ncbi:uncharacterized protein si:busm1-163l24.3 [Polyodon spathula]|uniref:uncharacterized protein si:busm1-163l24.3 n=1 Tax=Polyodon spathula TaxID=7913 RepID=UPI001B7E7406|nr:uncharacterized protein si:busm1-163l24.3 [Polyodon spathula]XP_041087659.1 uncharacterized protein si:busm1-163l24.3 [Polyodon spathula]
MAADGKTILVEGLMTDILEDRLADKLAIHFLRNRNGGGEITNITFPKESPGTALITFEESEVAQRVCRMRTHILSVDENKYEVQVSMHCTEVNPDEIFLRVSMLIDYRRLPDGKRVIKHLKKNFPDVQFSFEKEELCNVKGAFSEIQDLANEVLSSFETGEPKAVKNKKSQGAAGSVFRNGEKKTESTALAQPSGFDTQSPTFLIDNEDLHVDNGRGVVAKDMLEDYSLIMDSDIYRYIQKHWNDKYVQVLFKHKVEVVDVTAKDITTLYLQSETSGSLIDLQQAHRELGNLYQELETKLRKEQIPKKEVSSNINCLKKVSEYLQTHFPLILLNEDDTNIYMIGSSCDVSEAKQYIQDLKTEEHSSRLERQTSYQGLQDILHTDSTKLLDTNYKDLKLPGTIKPEVLKDYTLASGLGSCKEPLMKDISKGFQAFSSSGLYRKGLTSPDRTSEDILKKYEGTSTISKIKDRKLFQTTGQARSTGPIKPFQMTASSNTFQHMDLIGTRNYLYDSTAASTSQTCEFQPVLRRANSFSGISQSKEDNKSAGLNEVTESRSKKSNSGPKKEDLFCEDISMARMAWLYINDIYGTNIAKLTSAEGIQMNETVTGNSTKLVIRGFDQVKVSNAKRAISIIYSKVLTDFAVKEISLSQMGITDSDDILRLWCSEVEKHGNVKIIKSTQYLCIMGPKDQCLELTDLLQELVKDRALKPQPAYTGGSLFSSSSVTKTHQDKEQKSISKVEDYLKDQGCSLSKHNSLKGGLQQVKQTNSANGDNVKYTHSTQTHNQKEPENQTPSDVQKSPRLQTAMEQKDQSNLTSKGKRDPTSTLDKDKENPPSSVKKLGNEPGVKDTIKPTKTLNNKVISESHHKKADLTMASHAHKTDSCPQSLPTWAYSTQTNFLRNDDLNSSVQEENSTLRLQLRNPAVGQDAQDLKETSQTCMCCKKELGQNIRTTCGLALCTDCQPVWHASCRVCSVSNNSGIKGTMNISELSTSLSGFNRDTTLKITYNITDGIQSTGDPNPGNPYKGGQFQAFLPANAKGKELLKLLNKAFNQGLTFKIKMCDSGDTITWGQIPHKTKMEGGKSLNGYPDSSYLVHLTEVLTKLGIK